MPTPLYRLYLSLVRQDGGLTPVNDVFVWLEHRLDAFTAAERMGFFHGRRLKTLVVEIAECESVEIVPLARELAAAFDQKSVGIEHAGRFEHSGSAGPAKSAREDVAVSQKAESAAVGPPMSDPLC